MLESHRNPNMPIPPIILLDSFVVLVMFATGLRLTTGELIDVLRSRAVLIRTLLANCVLIPAIALLLVFIFPLTHDAKIGLLLIAAAPGTPIAMQFTSRVTSRLAFAAGMTALLSLAGIVITPLAVYTFPEAASETQRPLFSLLSAIALYMALPLFAGMWFGRRLPRIARRAVFPLVISATITFVFLMWETRLVRRQALHAIAGRGTILAMLLLLLLSMLLGWLSGEDRDTRRILTASTSMRNIAIVLYISRYCFPGTSVYMLPIGYLSIMVPANLLFYLSFMLWQRLHRPRAFTAVT
jgi:predicted Na+-dependent transporter